MPWMRGEGQKAMSRAENDKPYRRLCPKGWCGDPHHRDHPYNFYRKKNGGGVWLDATIDKSTNKPDRQGTYADTVDAIPLTLKGHQK